jgi:hypothetical protein
VVCKMFLVGRLTNRSFLSNEIILLLPLSRMLCKLHNIQHLNFTQSFMPIQACQTNIVHKRRVIINAENFKQDTVLQGNVFPFSH